jgi:DNA-binding response OmpR family regulator
MQLPSEPPPLRIYVVEDDDDIREETVFALGELGFDASGFGDAPGFYRALVVAPCDIAVVDIGLPGESGLSIVAHLRALRSIGMVLFTARSTLDDRVAGLRGGADAYLVKPVDMVELAETLKAVGRRLRASHVASLPAAAPDAAAAAAIGAPAQWSLHEGGWVLSDPQGRRMTLTATERAWLGCLIQRRGSAVSRDDLIAALGGDVFDFDQHRIDAIASRLRRKADRLGMRLPVHSVRGTGYVFAT